MSRKNIHAFTETGAVNYPGYISINREEEFKISVTLRARGHLVPAFIEMTPEQLKALAMDILAELDSESVEVPKTIKVKVKA